MTPIIGLSQYIAVLIVLKTSFQLGCGEGPEVTKVRDGVYKCPTSPVTARYADPRSKFCLYYFLCHKGHAFPRTCPLRYAFHPIKLECWKRDEIPEYICPFEIECGYNGYQVDPKDCTKYYLCFYRQPTHFSCTEGKIFNSSTSTCVTDRSRAKECNRPTMAPHYITTTIRSPRSVEFASNVTKGNSVGEADLDRTVPDYIGEASSDKILIIDPPDYSEAV